MGMMHVRSVRVAVAHRSMAMQVCVRLSPRIAWAMNVPMMFIVRMRMRVLHQLMLMFMVMLFGEVQPDAERHQ